MAWIALSSSPPMRRKRIASAAGAGSNRQVDASSASASASFFQAPLKHRKWSELSLSFQQEAEAYLALRAKPESIR